MNHVSARGKTRAIIVDDDTDLARSTALILKRQGFSVYVAYDGAAAIHQAEHNPFDIAPLDIKMPGMDGVETYKRLKAIQPDLAAIMMTGYSVEDRTLEALREGALAVLNNPLDLERLLDLIEKAMWKRSNRASRKNDDLADE